MNPNLQCEACQRRGKDWEGDDPRCAFLLGSFLPDNWNCATANALRDIVYEGQNPMPPGVDYRYCEDQKYATIQIDHLDIAAGALAMWVTWYKSRGTTAGVWLLFQDGVPRRPTEAEVVAVIEHFSRQSDPKRVASGIPLVSPPTRSADLSGGFSS